MSLTQIAILFFCFVPFGIASTPESAEEMLQRAEFLAARYAWLEALPLYSRAEQQFAHKGNSAKEALARLGRIRASVSHRSLDQIAYDLNREIRRSPLKHNPSFRLRALFLKADLGTDTDAYTAGTFDTEQRRRDWSEIHELSQKSNDRHLESRARGELAILKVLAGEPAASDDVAASLWHAKDTGDISNELRFRTAIAGMYRSAGRNHDALGHLDRALDLADQEQASSFFAAYFEKAVVLFSERQVDKALPLVDHCVSEARLTGSRVNAAQALFLQGMVKSERGLATEAGDLLRQTLDIAREVGYHRLVSMTSLELSKIYRISGALWKALDVAEQGLKSSLKTGDPFEAIVHIQNKAAIRADQGRFIEADRLYQEAIGALNALLAKFNSAHARAFIISRMSDLYADYYSVSLMKLKDPAKAFAILEQARGRSISDSLRGRMTFPVLPKAPEKQDSFVLFEKALADFQKRLWLKQDPPDFRSVLSEIFDLEQHLGSSRDAGRHAVEGQIFAPIPVTEIQEVLYPGEVILEYVLQEPHSTCLAIGRDNIHGITLASRSVIEEAVKNYREEIRQGRMGTEIARRLYALLLAPVGDLTQKLRITIVPDGLLHLLPFETLSIQPGRLLIETHMIDYSPAATVTFLLRKNSVARTRRSWFLGVGDARYPSLDESGSVFFANTPHPARLPGSRAEISAIEKALDGVSDTVTLLGENVSESAVKSSNLEDFDILHFAVHGTSDVDFPARSALLFGPESESDDDIFQAWEISRLRLRADLVVMSACDTAVGKVLDQEGISNLVHSFLLAGARSVVASIWPADDRSSADLMTRFYSFLAQGMDKGSALRQAKLDFIKKYQDKAVPIYWAGFVMIGDSSDSILGKHPESVKEETY